MTTSITKIPCKDLYEERAAITEFDGQLSRYLAELTAAKAQGFDNSIAISSAFFLDDNGNCNCLLCFQPTLPPTQRVQRAKTIQRFDKKASLDR